MMIKWNFGRALSEVKRKENSKAKGPEAGRTLVCLRRVVSAAVTTGRLIGDAEGEKA